MYDELVSALRGIADADLSTSAPVRFKRRLLELLLKRQDAFAFEGIRRSTLESIVASMVVELPLELETRKVNELAELYACVVERLYAASAQVGYADLDAAFRLQGEKMSLKLQE